MIKIDMLRAFAAVARTGSLNEGARRMARTPSAVSMTLKQLEDHLGGPLFEPGRKSRLTPLGSFVLEVAEQGLAHFARTTRTLEDFARARGGEVRIAAVPSFASVDLPGVVARFLGERPDVRLDVRDLDSASIVRELLQGRVDLGVVSDAREDDALCRYVLGTDLFGLIVRESDPLASRPGAAWGELDGVRLIDNPLCDRFETPVVRAALASAILRVHNTTTLVAMVRAGIGATALPARVVRGRAPGLAFVPLREPAFRRKLHLVHRTRDTLSPAAAVLRDALLARASPSSRAGRQDDPPPV